MIRQLQVPLVVSMLAGCVGPGPISSTMTTHGSSESGSDGITSVVETSTTSSESTTNDEIPDLTTSFETEDPECDLPDCNQLDVVIVVDNSVTMSEEQSTLAGNVDELVEQLAVFDPHGFDWVDVNIMVTSTDMGHPLCDPIGPDSYEPKLGAPQEVACIDRLVEFQPVPQACTDHCPDAVLPIDPFVHYDGLNNTNTNVPGNQIAEALRCLIPQGIVGCTYRSPLEAMWQAIQPTAAWNQGVRPFLRDDAALAIIVLTNGHECSVAAPEGYAYFVDSDQTEFWESNPETGTKTEATPAICWNAGVDCGMPDANGDYVDCVSFDHGVLHPIERYTQELGALRNKPVVMLGIVGVPIGGVDELVYHEWIEGAYPVGEELPGEPDAAYQGFEHGIGPGCIGLDAMGSPSGYAMPPVRLREVCESLDQPGSTRCCLESICSDDYGPALGCLGGLLNEI